MSRALLAALGVMLSLFALPGCSTQGLGFHADTRVKILSPRPGQEMPLPLDIRWSAHDLGPGTTFGVLLDRAAMSPGQTVGRLVDDQCRRTPGCPNASYFGQHGVYLASETRLSLATLPGTRPDRDHREHHELVIVLLDGATGRRMGDAAFTVEFFVNRNGGES